MSAKPPPNAPKPKRARDFNQLAKSVVDHATLDQAGVDKLREELAKERRQSPGNSPCKSPEDEANS